MNKTPTLNIPTGTIGTYQVREGEADGTETAVTLTVRVFADKGNGWYSGDVLATTSAHGITRPKMLIWGSELTIEGN